MKYRYTFRLKPGRDDDLIGWLEALGEGERSYSIRQTLRRGLTGPVAPAPPRVPIAAGEEPPRSVKQEIAGTAPDNDIEAKLDRLAGSF